MNSKTIYAVPYCTVNLAYARFILQSMTLLCSLLMVESRGGRLLRVLLLA